MRKKRVLIGLGIAGGVLVAIVAVFGALVAYTRHSLNGLEFDFDDDELYLM